MLSFLSIKEPKKTSPGKKGENHEIESRDRQHTVPCPAGSPGRSPAAVGRNHTHAFPRCTAHARPGCIQCARTTNGKKALFATAKGERMNGRSSKWRRASRKPGCDQHRKR